MKPIGMNKGRSALAAVFLGLAMPGLGQVYNGESIKGISYFIIALSSIIIGFRLTLFLPDGMLLFGALATILAAIAVYAASIIDARRKASLSDTAYQLKSYNCWYFYLALWLLGSVAINAAQGYVRDNCLEAYKIPTGSMEPAVLRGDRVLADKTAYRRTSPKIGDIVIFINPDDRSKKYIKRIEALPGDSYTDADGGIKVVPHGLVYVLGDNREHSVDSRQLGLVPLRDIIAKVRQIYYSPGRK
jgi:signal peptidase I